MRSTNESLRITRDRFPQFHDRLVSDISPRDLEKPLLKISPGGRNPVMRYLRAVFNFGIKRGYLIDNPIARLDFADRPRKEVETLSNEQAKKMLEHALEHDLQLLPYLTLGMFAGIRPDGELQKVEWSDISLADKVVTIRPDVSKTKRRRFVDLSDNAKSWLETFNSTIRNPTRSHRWRSDRKRITNAPDRELEVRRWRDGGRQAEAGMATAGNETHVLLELASRPQRRKQTGPTVRA